MPVRVPGRRRQARTCSDTDRTRYVSRLGGPLLDRIDVCLRVDRVDPARILAARASETTEMVAQRVARCRAFAIDQGRDPSRRLGGADLLRACSLGRSERAILTGMARSYHLSGRGVTRLMRVARTVADLSGCARVEKEHLLEAAGYRAWQS